MATTWVVAADASRARVLQVASRKKLTEIASLDNPEGIQDRDPLVKTPAVEHATEMFAKRIGDYLEKARTRHRYDKLVVIAPPHLLGALRKEYGKEVGRLVADEWRRTSPG